MTHLLNKSSTPSVGEIGQLRNSNIQLRKEVEKLKRDVTGKQAQLDATQNQLRESELARAATEEYSRKLENVSVSDVQNPAKIHAAM